MGAFVISTLGEESIGILSVQDSKPFSHIFERCSDIVKKWETGTDRVTVEISAAGA